MLFNSLDFAVFIPIVFILFWFVLNKSLKLQNILIVVASYVFYGWWDWRFLSLIIISTFIDYSVAFQLDKTEKSSTRKLLLAASIAVNLSFLGFFKYYDFFIYNFVEAFSLFGLAIQPNTLNIILPVGISFYTFQTMSYTIDVYRKQLEPTKNFLAFAAFVSFFPQLVAGPIERATRLLPQFYSKRRFNQRLAIDGLRQILWGLFKKVVIADNCAEYANLIFNNHHNYSGAELLLGAVFFAFQIYGDFSGYSDIAIGTSRLFGFDLKRNFAFPYFSRDIAEFWRRWHISLSTWFRDYLYIPLGGSKGGNLMKIRNTFIIFLVSGFWHGANWTFIAWGFINALYFLPLFLTKRNRSNMDIVAKGKFLPSLREFTSILSTFTLTVFAWIFFRAENVAQALNYIQYIFLDLGSLLSIDVYMKYWIILMLIISFLTMEWIGREGEFALSGIKIKSILLRWGIYFGLILSIFWFQGSTQGFIYFQF